jgi:hypothetical protein
MSRNQQTLSKLTVIKQLKDLRENKIEKVKRTENSKGNKDKCDDPTDFPNGGQRRILESNFSYRGEWCKPEFCLP